MLCLSMLFSNEWVKIQQAANQQFPNETLSRSEICRLYVLAGIEAVGSKTEEERKQLAREYHVSVLHKRWTIAALMKRTRQP